ncbi:MAG: T9SS type A sorting domain-containing protein [Bacteroidia bacterium]|nr:T9SS type A sorting domain-containing protein [Bacteroidia bacterium]
MKKTLPLLFLASAMAFGQTPNLLKDINTGAPNSKFGEFSVLPTNNIVFGVATPSSSTNGIWFSDGSTVGTKQLKSLPGTFTTITEYNSKKYFTANTPGYILWRTDGTVAGTDSIPNANLLSATSFTVVNNLLFFIGNTAANGTELWRSDGTIAGTYMVKDIWATTGNALSTFSNYKGFYNGFLYFLANNGINGAELWKTDGTTAGTNLLKDINPGTATSNITNLKVGNNGLYFYATEPATGTELWYSDGTIANTQLIKDVATGTASAYASELTFAGNYAYYHYGKTIYKSNGTSAGTTTLYISVAPSMSLSTPMQEAMDRRLEIHNNEVYFLIKKNDVLSPFTQTDSLLFCKSDLNLTSVTRVLVSEFSFPGISNLSSTQLASTGTSKHGSSFIYVFANPLPNYHIFVFNPTLNHVKANYNKFNSYSQPMTTYQTFGNKLYFPFPSAQDNEPAYLDLSNDNIYLIKNINPVSSCFYNSGGPSSGNPFWNYTIYTLNNKNYFLANAPGSGLEFWETDFTTLGTNLVKDIYPGANDFDYISPIMTNNYGKINGVLTPNNFFFAANDGVNGLELWSFINTPNSVGIDNQTLNEDVVQIFPNPGSEKITIQSPELINEIKVCNALGAVVKKEDGNQNKEANINVSDLCNGIYFIIIKTTSGESTHKFIKN